jgi:hypothetical protein
MTYREDNPRIERIESLWKRAQEWFQIAGFLGAILAVIIGIVFPGAIAQVIAFVVAALLATL